MLPVLLIICVCVQVNGYLSESVEDKLNKLESDKQSLMLQVSVLTDQVEAQAEKISEMEYSLDDRREKLINTEDMLQTVSRLQISYMS